MKNLSPAVKIIILILPLVRAALYISLFAYGDEVDVAMRDTRWGAMILPYLYMGIFMLYALTVVVYIVHAFKSGRVKKSLRDAWIVPFIFLPTIFCPIYWFRFVRPKEMKTEEAEKLF